MRRVLLVVVAVLVTGLQAFLLGYVFGRRHAPACFDPLPLSGGAVAQIATAVAVACVSWEVSMQLWQFALGRLANWVEKRRAQHG